ncbi:hypothetical protein OF83DRAFT_1141433 [Amylostereum chailletii]|nr:hypothetical protein OF83DRAFT_1141433 [Amylostereum chailletii]
MPRTNLCLQPGGTRFVCRKATCRRAFASQSASVKHRKSCCPTPEDKAGFFRCFLPDCKYRPAAQRCNRDKHVRTKHRSLYHWLAVSGLSSRKPHTPQRPRTLPELLPLPSYAAAHLRTRAILTDGLSPVAIVPFFFFDRALGAPARGLAYLFPPEAFERVVLPTDFFQREFWAPFMPAVVPADPAQPYPWPPVLRAAPWQPSAVEVHRPRPVYPPQSYALFLERRSLC